MQAHVRIIRQGLGKLYVALPKRTKTGKNSGWKECRCAYIHPFIPTSFLCYSARAPPLPWPGWKKKKKTKTQTQRYLASKKAAELIN